MKTTKIHLFWGNILFSIDLFLTCVPPFLALLKLSFQFRYFLGRIFWRLEFQIQILRSLLQRLRRDHVFGLKKVSKLNPFDLKRTKDFAQRSQVHNLAILAVHIVYRQLWYLNI